MPVASAVPVPAGLPLWEAALVGCAVVTGFGAVRRAGRVAPGDTVCVVGCGGVGLQIVAAAAMAGAGQDRRGRPRSGEARARARRAVRPTLVDATAGGASAAVLAHVPGGVDHAFEAIGLPATIRLAWDVLRPGATAIVVGIAPVGVEVALPALELLSEKGLRGSFYGSGDPAAQIGELATDAAEGRLPIADAVSHLGALEDVEAALGRLRRGEGARTVLVLDPALAGAPGQWPS